MTNVKRTSVLVAASLFVFVAFAPAAEWGLKKGTPQLKSAGPLAFGPDGILLVGDTKAATIFAIDTQDKGKKSTDAKVRVLGINEKIAKVLEADVAKTSINDLAVNPISGNIYLSVSTPRPAIVRVTTTGQISQLPLENVPFSSATLPNAPDDREYTRRGRTRNNRDSSITDLAYTDGKVLVSGLSKGEASSTVREIEFPLVGTPLESNLEIFHGAHGRYEDNAPVRTFVPFNIGGEAHLLAGFTCTPLVKVPLKSLQSGEKVRGTTVAELGNRNTPLDMIVYEKGGETFVLMANDRRGVMKISTKDIERQQGITERIPGGGKAGQPYETIEELQGVEQLDRLNDLYAVVLVKSDTGAQDLHSIELP